MVAVGGTQAGFVKFIDPVEVFVPAVHPPVMVTV
jgi:hypothetical protein